MSRVVGPYQPAYVFLENLAQFRRDGGMEPVLRELGTMGYDCRWVTL